MILYYSRLILRFFPTAKHLPKVDVVGLQVSTVRMERVPGVHFDGLALLSSQPEAESLKSTSSSSDSSRQTPVKCIDAAIGMRVGGFLERRRDGSVGEMQGVRFYLVRKTFISVSPFPSEVATEARELYTSTEVLIDGELFRVCAHPDKDVCLAVRDLRYPHGKYSFSLRAVAETPSELLLTIRRRNDCLHPAGSVCLMCCVEQIIQKSSLYAGPCLWVGSYGEVSVARECAPDEDGLCSFSDPDPSKQLALKRFCNQSRHNATNSGMRYVRGSDTSMITWLTPMMHPSEAPHITRSSHLAACFARRAALGHEENLQREVEIMNHISTLSAPVQVPVAGVAQAPQPADMFSSLKLFGICRTNLYIATDLLPGQSLFTLLCRTQTGRLSERAAKHVFKTLLQAVCYLHEQHITHGDMKIENTAFRVLEPADLADEDFLRRISSGAVEETDLVHDADFMRLQAVVIDFGRAVYAQVVPDCPLHDCVCVPAPQDTAFEKRKSADLKQLSLMLRTLLTGIPNPVLALTENDLMDNFMCSVSGECFALYTGLKFQNCSAAEALRHCWFTNA